MVDTKGKSPFYPGQPIPAELFTGRDTQIRRIKARGVDQVAAGKPVSMYIRGEYGIGKSSIANYIRAYSERHCQLHGVYIALGRAQGLTDVAAALLARIPWFCEETTGFLPAGTRRRTEFIPYLPHGAHPAHQPNSFRFVPAERGFRSTGTKCNATE